jgi:tripartite-type tricarboxylate transporter receptor subunit TctC
MSTNPRRTARCRSAMSSRRLGLLAVALPALLLAAAPALAQEYPARPLRIVHGFTPGGPVDIIARLVAAQFGERFGQSAIVEGKPGAGGTVGANFVAKSEPDGYTLFLMASGHATAPGLYKSLPYDAVEDFAMVSMLASSPFAIATKPGTPFNSIQDLVQRARAEPGRVDIGTGGVGSGMHLVSVLFQSRLGIQLNHVPYKGGNAPVLALLSGEIPVIFTSVAGITPQVESGKMKVLAVTTKQRFSQMPNVPTVAETVVPDFDALAWYALAGPKKLPAPVLAKLNGAVLAALKQPDVANRMHAQGAEPWGTTPREAQAFLAAEVQRWTKAVRDARIPPQD